MNGLKTNMMGLLKKMIERRPTIKISQTFFGADGLRTVANFEGIDYVITIVPRHTIKP